MYSRDSGRVHFINSKNRPKKPATLTQGLYVQPLSSERSHVGVMRSVEGHSRWIRRVLIRGRDNRVRREPVTAHGQYCLLVVRHLHSALVHLALGIVDYGLKQLGCSTALHQTKVTEENNEASTRNES